VRHFDAFNGDADGICSLLQLRLDAPVDSMLVTGAKRDVALLQRISAGRGDAVTALDISMAANREALLGLLERGATVQYFDHHFAGDLPSHRGLDAHIDTSPGVCTGMIVDRYLKGRQRPWAVVAAFGDNLSEAARELAAPLALSPAQVDVLQELGEGIAYNAYGDSEADLIVPPAELYLSLRRQADPFRFMREEPAFQQLLEARADDLERARAEQPHVALARAAVYVLPDAPWAHRVRGAFGDELANASPRIAHAILTPNAQGGYTVSVRAPRVKARGADGLCRQFATGGGRSAAAGINHLPEEELPEFVRRFDQAFS
jgi:hypothetical protein